IDRDEPATSLEVSGVKRCLLCREPNRDHAPSLASCEPDTIGGDRRRLGDSLAKSPRRGEEPKRAGLNQLLARAAAEEAGSTLKIGVDVQRVTATPACDIGLVGP